MYYAPIELTRFFAQCLGWNEKCLVVMLSEGRAMFPQLFKRGNEKIFQRPKKLSRKWKRRPLHVFSQDDWYICYKYYREIHLKEFWYFSDNLFDLGS